MSINYAQDDEHPRKPAKEKEPKATRGLRNAEGDGLVSLNSLNSSYFVPGKLWRTKVRFLLDTGCALNVISSRIFNTLPLRIRSSLRNSNLQGRLADGKLIKFLGETTLEGKVRTVSFKANFVVADIERDAILGMSA